MSAFKTWLTGLTSKTTPVDADETYLVDSEAAGTSKKLTWSSIKATLKTYFDGLYLALTGGTVAGGTRTTSGSTLTITETLNNAAVTFPGALVVDVTSTASAAASLVADFKVGGASVCSLRKDGLLYPAIGINIGNNRAIYVNGTAQIGFVGGQNQLINTSFLGWAASPTSSGNATTRLYSDTDYVLALRNSTNAQTFRNYGTYTDASNYRRVALAMTTAGVATLAPEGAGTGASGNVLHISGLPTSNPGAGILWNDTGTVKVGT